MEAIIIGGGAAGLAASVFIPRSLVLERAAQPGRKLLVTGGGRCNLTHICRDGSIERHFPGYERFVRNAFRAFSPEAQVNWFEHELGLECVEEGDGFVYPASNKAADVLSALLAASSRAGSAIETGVKATRIIPPQSSTDLFKVESSSGKVYEAERVILAAGGAARPMLGTDGSGHRLAADLGIAVEQTRPALGALHLAPDDYWLAPLAGVTIVDALLTIGSGKHKEEVRGSLLLAGHSLSGPAALNICARISTPCELQITWNASMRTIEQWLETFGAWRKCSGTTLVKNLLARYIPKSLSEALCAKAGVGQHLVAAQLPRDVAIALAALCAHCPVQIAATDGFDRCMATCGGIDTREVNPTTLSSRAFPRLSFAGEVLAPVGDCGGYNLAWAWASAALIGASIGVKKNKS